MSTRKETVYDAVDIAKLPQCVAPTHFTKLLHQHLFDVLPFGRLIEQTDALCFPGRNRKNTHIRPHGKHPRPPHQSPDPRFSDTLLITSSKH